MISRYIFVFCLGLLISIIILFILRKLFLCLRILVSKEITLVGGVGICIAWVSSLMLVAFNFDASLDNIIPVVVLSIVILILGVIDDIREATVVQKFLLQLLCASLLVALDIRTHIIYLSYWENIIISLLWILGITNAFNLLDIMDGLSSGVSLIAASAIFVVSYAHNDANLQIVSLGLAGAITGFLFFNFPPAKIYLGNSGSHFLGFIFAALTLMLSYAKVEAPMALLSPILILWLAILESAFLIYFRLKKGIMPFNKSDDHIALRLLAFGLPRKTVLFLMLSFASIFALCGIIIIKVNNVAAVLIVFLVLFLSLGLFQSLRGGALDV